MIIAVALATLSLVGGLRRRSDRAGCGAKGASGLSMVEITNGEDADECEWRWQAAIYKNDADQDGNFCGGSLINAEWVLTAASCVGKGFAGHTPYKPHSPWYLHVKLGVHNSSRTSAQQQSHRVSQTFAHPKYDHATGSHDVALIRLESPASMNSCVGTVCLPSGVPEVTADTKCWITGWGLQKEGGWGTKPEVLKEGEVSVWSNKDCAKQYGSKQRIGASQMCANAGRWWVVDTCNEDVGGPLVCEVGGKWTVFGVTSRGEGCGNRNKPGIYARVRPEVSWIQKTIRSAPAKAPPVRDCGENAYGPDEDGNCNCAPYYYCYENGKPKCPKTNGDRTQRLWWTATCKGCKCSAKRY